MCTIMKLFLLSFLLPPFPSPLLLMAYVHINCGEPGLLSPSFLHTAGGLLLSAFLFFALIRLALDTPFLAPDRDREM